MVFYTPPLQNLPAPVTPVNKDRSVVGVQPVGDRRREEPDRRKGRSLRHRLIDLLMEEVEGLPDLSDRQKQRIRRNLDRFAERQPVAPPATERGPPVPSPLMTDALPPIIDHVPLPPEPDQAIAALTAEDPEELATAATLVDGMDATQLAHEIKRLLALHSEQAAKIASYIQALKTVTPEDHQVDLDI